MDTQAKRLGGAIMASLLINGLLWRAFGSVVMGQKAAPPQIIEISRVVLTPQGQAKPKVVTPQQVKRRVETIRKLTPPRRLVRPLDSTTRPPRIVAPSRPRVQPRALRVPAQAPQSEKPAKPSPPRPEGAHHRVLTAPEKAVPDAGSVKAGGQAQQGQTTNAQNFGEKKTNPANYSPPAPQAQPTQLPFAQGTPEARATIQPPAPTSAPLPNPTATPVPRPTATTKPTATPEPTSTPRPTATPEPTSTPRPTATPEPTSTPRPTAIPEPTSTPRPTATPRPKGPTRDAEATRQVQPDIPDDLRDAQFKSSVRVRVEVSASGSASASLRTSSGNAQIDSLVLRALNRWRWKPALKDGEPIASTQYFRFDFEVK